MSAPAVRTMPEADYFGHDALSCSGAKRLLPPSCPAIFAYEREHGRPEKRAYDFGHAAHAKVLGVGAPVVVVQADDWRSKAAREQRDEAYANGYTPLLAAEAAQVDGMATALASHPIASALFDPAHGKPEQSLFWQDKRTGVQRRARLDWLPEARDGRVIVADYKTTRSANPTALAKSADEYGFHMQAAWYMDGVIALGLAEFAGFVFVCQEKNPPYLVTCIELDADAVTIGRGLNDRALEVYAECSATGEWPGYTDDIELLSLSGWALNRHQEFLT